LYAEQKGFEMTIFTLQTFQVSVNSVYHVIESIKFFKSQDYYLAFQDPVRSFYDDHLARRALMISHLAMTILTLATLTCWLLTYPLRIPSQLFLACHCIAGLSSCKLLRQEKRLGIQLLIHAVAILRILGPFKDPIYGGMTIGLKLAQITQ
jgi:hypothetical protein